MNKFAEHDKQVVAKVMQDQLTTYRNYISDFDKQCYLHVLHQFIPDAEYRSFCDKWNLYTD